MMKLNSFQFTRVLNTLLIVLLFTLFQGGHAFAQEPVAPSTGAYYTGNYPNLLLKAGYSQEEIDAKIDQTFRELFEGPNRIYLKLAIRWLMFPI